MYEESNAELHTTLAIEYQGIVMSKLTELWSSGLGVIKFFLKPTKYLTKIGFPVSLVVLASSEATDLTSEVI
jgi:hypothetical protein